MSASSAEISIILLTYNGDRYLEEVLEAIFSQRTSFSYEVIAIDSGSTDRSVAILKNHPVRLIQIPNREFGHGRTRNFGAQHAIGRYVVYLTQDATPANELWLENLARPLAEDPRLAGSYSRQIPRPECNPIESRDISLGAGPLRIVKKVDLQDPIQKDLYDAHQSRFITFSNVSSCIRRDVLLRMPFSEPLVMVEDQEWCKRAIESGWWVIYESTSSVYHSHNHSLRTIFARHYDYGRSLREFIWLPISIKGVLLYTICESLGDTIYILGQRIAPIPSCGWILKAPIIRFAMRYGLYKGLHENGVERLPTNPEVLTKHSLFNSQ